MKRLSWIFRGLCILAFSSVSAGVLAQDLPVGSIVENYYRRAQLEGKVDSTISFSIRPLSAAAIDNDLFFPDSTSAGRRYQWGQIAGGEGFGKFLFKVLPVESHTRFTSHHPAGWNDGSMVPAKGFQNVSSAGFFAGIGPFSLQLKPEYVSAANKSFRGFPQDNGEVLWWTLYYDYYNNVDLPERFGTGSISRLNWGQSSFRISFDPVSLGISNENLWLGPGIQNSLLMSNTAPGFKHITLNTGRPVQTPAGSFEAQVIAGRLEGSGFGPMEPNPIYFGNPLYLEKRDDWRYISGYAFSWQPKWVPGLFLGLNSTKQMYNQDMGKGDFLPRLWPFGKTRGDEAIDKHDEYSSAFFRWLWPQEKAEIYFEYGLNDPSGTFGDFVKGLDKSRAFTFGLRRLLPFKASDNQSLLISLEATQLQQTSARAIRSGESWYVDPFIRHGYTHQGEVLGAGVGPGGNSQTLDISWVKGLKRIGVQIQRYVHNNDYYYYAFEPSLDWRRHWTDLGVSFSTDWDFRNFIVDARIQIIHSFNYKWYLQQDPAGPYTVPGIDASNIQAQIGISYRF